MLTPGLTYTATLTVTPAHTAEAMGSGDLPVLATPAMLALMEQAAMKAVANSLAEGETTVGGHIEASHLAPTPVGATVTATATLEKVEGRRLTFSVSSESNGVCLGRGTHLRFVVDRERFMSKVESA